MTPQNDPTIPFGYCHCGCGQKTKAASKTMPNRSWIEGQPLRFIHGHNRRDKNAVGKTSLYTIWTGMKQRCSNPKNPFFARYGGRGIKVCDRWQKSFQNFANDMGDRLDGLTVERKDNDGNYEPSNCEWATQKTQGNNTSVNRKVEWNGATYTATQLAEHTGIKYETLLHRLKLGWPIATIISRRIGYRNAVKR